MTHDLNHALFPARSGCTCNMHDIHECVICGRLKPFWTEGGNGIDTCCHHCNTLLREFQAIASDDY